MIKKINSIIFVLFLSFPPPTKTFGGKLQRESSSRVSGFPIKTFGNDNLCSVGKDTRSTRGQTALILILLTAAALIFLAITLNWGRIARTKALLSMAADQSASLLASDAASYGQQQKQTYLNDTNQLTESTGLTLGLAMVIFAIFVSIITIGSGAGIFLVLLSLASVVMAGANLALQVMVVQPGITSLWNKSQSNQPIPQQLYEGGIVAALQASVQDQVNITDYFNWNSGNQYGNPNSTVIRFAVFYSDRLKMINGASPSPIPQVQTFYTQLGCLMKGPSFSSDCAQNSFQLNDACTGSDPTNTATYSPYCDPCCQPLTVPCDDSSACVNNKCSDGSSCPSVRPSSCASDASCSVNNPYGSPYLDIYDPSFQNNYATRTSFLEQFGRDQQMGPFTTSLSPNVIFPASGTTPAVEFPNGIYPFFWLARDYSPEVENINPITNPLTASSPALHWCASATAAVNGVDIPAFTAAPKGFTDLAQLNLTQPSPNNYSCQGPDCCVNYLANSVVSVGGVPTPSGNGTANGAIDIVGSGPLPNPANDPSFGEGGSGTWLEGDNQMCETATWPYNGSSATGPPDGTCELTGTANPPPASSIPPWPSSTVDGLDDTMHTLSDFVNFANSFLSNNVGTLSSTFSSWYPQAADWVAPCDDGSACVGNPGHCTDGTSCPVGRLLPLPANLNTWNGVITNWLNYTVSKNAYVPAASPYPWCVPPGTDSSMNVNGSPTTENNYIANNGGAWGSWSSVLACLNYNSNLISNNGSIYNYQQCLNALPANACPAATSSIFTAGGQGACDPLILGRSLAGPNPNNFNGSCDTTAAGSYAKWVSDSVTLFTDEAPKFALRSAFLTDVSTRANTMQTIFSPAATALNTFLNPDQSQSTLSPSAGLTWAFNNQTAASLPNSVIYGWVDNPLNGSGGCGTDGNGKRVGCAHIVKVTVYSPGRSSGSSLPLPLPQSGGSLLPWIKTKTTNSFLGIPLSRSYTLMNRDGVVWAGVRRWDEDHNPVLFPNGHTLWQSLFHNPNGTAITGQSALPPGCIKVPLGSAYIGFGLEPSTVAGLQTAGISQADVNALGEAFMINGSGIDPPAYSTRACLSDSVIGVNALLANAPESHACAAYIAQLPTPMGTSSPWGQDYSVVFLPDAPANTNCPVQSD